MTDEQHILHLISDRLEHGRKQYGDLDLAADKRDWNQEALEEALDLAVYLACALIKRRSRINSVCWRIKRDGLWCVGAFRNDFDADKKLATEVYDRVHARRIAKRLGGKLVRVTRRAS